MPKKQPFTKKIFGIIKRMKPKKTHMHLHQAKRLKKKIIVKSKDYLKKNYLKILLTLSLIIIITLLIYKNWNWLNITLIDPSEINEILKVLVRASSIIVSIIIGFMVTKHFDIKKYRVEMLNKFIKLQTELREYQCAFYMLSDQMGRTYPIDPKYPTPYHELLRNPDFWENDENKPYGSFFVRSLREFGRDYWEFGNYEIDRRIIGKDYLLLINEAITQVNGFLTRYKHYKYILSDFGLAQRQDMRLSNIATDTLGVKYHAMRISPDDQKKNWRTLEFWYDRIIEATEITEKMINLLPFIHDYKAKNIKRPMHYLILSSIFGIISPLILLSLNINPLFEFVLTYISTGGFLICFIVLVSILYKEIVSRKILAI